MDVSCEARPRVEPPAAFELKGTVTPVTVLCLRTSDVERIVDELRVRIGPAPQMFLNAPIVIDLGELRDVDVALASLAERLRACKLTPIGVANVGAAQLGRAVEAGLAVVQLSRQRAPGVSALERPGVSAIERPGVSAVERARDEEPRPERAERAAAVERAIAAARQAGAADKHPPPPEPVPVSTLTVTQPVRSGQVLYAQRADLVVLAPVNPGAQVIADGHIHVYGPLRGRALAGAQGLGEARVFCQSLEAELVSVAGQYLTADEMPKERRGRPSQIFVEQGRFRILPL
jgi:septum site-determining protein MinC